MAEQMDDLVFAEDIGPSEGVREGKPWKIMIVDDEQDVHDVTRLALRRFSFDHRGLQFISAYSGEQAKQLMREHHDIAVVLLDVVMEDDDSGLRVVKFIREELADPFMRIVLRTGQPGRAPERFVITNYDINDYKTKTELTAERLFSTIITALRSYRAEIALYHEKERVRVTLQSIGDGVITTDAELRVAYLNPAAEKLTGWSQASARGRPLDEVLKLVDDMTLQPVENPIVTALSEGRVVRRLHNIVLERADGEHFIIEESAAPMRDRDGRIVGGVLAFHDVTQTRDLAHRLAWQAIHDALTGLVNRRGFEHEVRLALDDAKTNGGSHTLLYLDLDNFKLINDTCGHVAGDELLKQLALSLQTKIRQSDTLARLGGDEFGILLGNCSEAQAMSIAEHICQAVRDFRFVWEDQVLEVGASIGLVGIGDDSETLSSLLSAADVACYVAKEEGGGRIHVYRESSLETVRRRREMQWASRISRAIECGQLRLYYQPIVPLQDSVSPCEHFEVLLRMRDDSDCLVAPDSFIPAAERFQLMPRVDRWVVRRVLACYAEYTRMRTSEVPHLCCINLSGTSLSDGEFLNFVRDEIRARQISPGSICFEITETAAIANLARATFFMRELKELGCRFALDDFGSGLSSFAYLKNLPVDFLKIDGGFVRGIDHDPVACAMVDAINQVGHLMGIKTVAEYAENERVLEKLRDMGVDYAQGHGVSVARPLEEIVKL